MKPIGHANLEPQSLRDRLRADAISRFARDRADIRRLAFDVALSGFRAGELEELVDQAE